MPFPQVYTSTCAKTRGITIKYGTLGLILKIGCFMTNTYTERSKQNHGRECGTVLDEYLIVEFGN